MPNKLPGLLVGVGVLVVFTVAAFFALGVKSVFTSTASAQLSAPNPGHGYDQIGLPAGTWPGLDADKVDGLDASELAGAPSGFSILGSTATPPAGYTFSGNLVVADDIWTSKASMPTARAGLAAAAVNNRIYAIGGSNGSTQLQTVEEYDPATNTWTSKASMPTARWDLAAVAVNNKIYAIGGFDGSTYLTTVEECSPPVTYYVHEKS